MAAVERGRAVAERDDALVDMLQQVAPGTVLRAGIERIIKAGKGALIVLGYDKQMEELRSGGFQLKAKLTAQHLSEVAKMDGAILIDNACENILWANVHLVPDSGIPTMETGTRHRTADRMAKQTNIPVISVSESMQIVSVYVGGHKHVLEELSSIMFRANQALATLERYRNRLDEVSAALSALEIENVVTLGNVVQVLQRAERVARISEEIEHAVAELGTEGRLLQLQLDELLLGVESERELVVADYLADRRRKVSKVMEALAALDDAELLEHGKVARALGYSPAEQGDERPVTARGYRLLSRIPRLPDQIVEKLVDKFSSVDHLLDATLEDLGTVDGIGETRARAIKEGLARLAESSILERYA
ncbi:DNA integrity scanning diadenylate cyclase DisA [Euzebya rosea]|uniref:DNA integrity scanning diadenylate cyclase DisA n=1 Tax=Euzebya rosea TaxID=2052804 RepID=UPI000D3EA70C